MGGGRLYEIRGETIVEVEDDFSDYFLSPNSAGVGPLTGFDSTELEEFSAEMEKMIEQNIASLSISPLLRPAEMMRYFGDLQTGNLDLYRHLIEEVMGEHEIAGIARDIRMMPQGEEREQKEEYLKERLDEMFEMKQENRRREIERLENKLRELQNDLEEREEVREQMIRRRQEELLYKADERGRSAHNILNSGKVALA